MGAIAEIDREFATVPDQELLGCVELMEKRRRLIFELVESPSVGLDHLSSAVESTARLGARTRQARETVIASLASSRRSQNLVRALSEPAPPRESAIFG
jgi:hypothetical protein